MRANQQRETCASACREHGMGAIVNGLALTRGITHPYSATFLQFSDYMRAALRLGALMEIPALYIFSHDSIGLGEDGPHAPACGAT